MGHSQAEKSLSRARILNQASQQIRSEGLDSLSVGKLMKNAGLTHGGFYVHFESRADLLVHALEQALQDGRGAFEQSRKDNEPNYVDVVRGYLSRKHRDTPATGCAMAALAGDVAHADSAMRSAMAGHIESFVESISTTLGEKNEGKASLAVAALIGGLIISRVMSPSARSDEFLAQVKRELLALQTSR